MCRNSTVCDTTRHRLIEQKSKLAILVKTSAMAGHAEMIDMFRND